MTDWYDIDWKEEREELAEIEHSEVITVPEETDEEEETCTCEFEEKFCLVHNPQINEEDTA